MAGLSDGRPPPKRSGNASFEGLTAEQHRTLAYASAIGSEFDFSLLLAALGTEEEVLAEEVERLVHQAVLVERSGGERFAFVDEGFRARIYRSLTESRLRVLHRKVAEVLERLNPNPTLPVLTELGRHYFLGKVPAKSYEYNRRAAEAARAAGEPEVAATHLERVLLDLASLPGDHREEQAEVAEALGDLDLSLGNYRGADLRYTEALERHADPLPRVQARLLLSRAEVARENLEFDMAVVRGSEALRLFEKAGDRPGEGQAHRLLGRVAFRRGAYREALGEYLRAMDLVGTTGDPRLLGGLSIDMGNTFGALGPDVREIAIACYERAVELLLRSGNKVELSRAYHNLGVTLGETRPQDGLGYLEKAAEVADQVHDTRGAARALLSRVRLLLALGQLEDAQRDNEQVDRLLVHKYDELGRGWVRMNRGLIAERRGLWDEAERSFEQAVETCRRLKLPPDEAEAAFYLARLRYKVRDLEGARLAYATAAKLGFVDLHPDLASQFLDLAKLLGLAAIDASRGVGPASAGPAGLHDERGP
jgi:tetratricopeptide (TPR) repeat protein